MIAPLLLSLVPSPAPEGAWVTEIAFQAPDKLGACTVGDVDPRHPGNEIVTVCRDGAAYVLHRSAGGWVAEEIARTPGEMIQVAVGDLLPERPGLEIVLAGAAEGPEADDEPGMAWIAFRDAEQWRAEPLYESPKLLHAVTVHGGRVLLAGYDRELVVLARAAGSDFTATVVGELPGAGKCLVTAGRVSFLACKDGSLVRVESPPGDERALALRVVQRRDAGRARLATDGERALVCDDDGTLSLVRADGGAEVVYREGDKLRGAVLADLDPEREGAELATVGYERRLTVLHRGAEGSWLATPVLRETEKFHGLSSGDLDGDGDHELVACGYSGRLLVVDRWRR